MEVTRYDQGAYSASMEEIATLNDVEEKASRAANPTAGNLAALTAQGNLADAGYHFEVRGGIPCIVQYT